MKKIALTAAALLVAAGSAFAGSDHYGSDGANQPAAAVDSSYTASIAKTGAAAKQPFIPNDAHDIFGNR